MECNCGGETIFHEHTLKTLTKAREWNPEIDHVPVTIRRDVCRGCGRQLMRKYKYPVDVPTTEC